MGKVTDLTQSQQFEAGLFAGCIGVAIVVLIAVFQRRGMRLEIAGLATAGAALAALQGWGPHKAALALDTSLLAAIVVLAVGGLAIQVIDRDAKWSPAIHAILLVPGGAAMGWALRDAQPTWVPIAIAIAAPVFGATTIDLDRFHRRRAFGPAMLIVTICGVYVTVPDTEGSRALVGAVLPLIVLVLPRPLATLGAMGSAAIVGVVLAVAVTEGAPRPGSIVGAFAGFGFLVIEPIARRVMPELKGRDGHDPGDHFRNTAVALTLQGILVAWATRVAGLTQEALPALLTSAVGVVAGFWTAARLPRPPLPEKRRRRQQA